MARNYEREDREEYWRRQEQNRNPQDRWSGSNREEDYNPRHMQETRGREGRERWGSQPYDEQRWERQERNSGREGEWGMQGGRSQGEQDWQGRQRNQDWQEGRSWQGGGRERDWEGNRGWRGEQDRGQWMGMGEQGRMAGGTQREGYGSRGMGGGFGEGQWFGRARNEGSERWSEQDWNRGGMQGRFAGRGPRNYKRSDQRLEEDINEQLTRHPMLDASDIEVSVQNCEVTLRGHVTEREDKRIAEDIAESVFGVKDVNNQIKVRQRGQGEENRQDRQDTDTSAKRERKAS